MERKDTALPGNSDRAAAEKSTFVETSYLLIYGKLPNREELAAFSESVNRHPSFTKT